MQPRKNFMLERKRIKTCQQSLAASFLNLDEADHVEVAMWISPSSGASYSDYGSQGLLWINLPPTCPLRASFLGNSPHGCVTHMLVWASRCCVDVHCPNRSYPSKITTSSRYLSMSDDALQCDVCLHGQKTLTIGHAIILCCISCMMGRDDWMS